MAAGHKLKIGLVLDTSLDPPDGVQQYVISLGEWLRSQGHDVHYLVGETSRQDLPNIHSLARNIGVQFNGNRTTIPLPTSKRKLQRFLAGHKFDVLHVQMPHSPFMAQRLIVAADRRTAIIGTFHVVAYSWLGAIGTRILGLWLRRSLRRFDRIVSVSSAAADFASRSFKVETEVLPNVIDYHHFHEAQPLPAYADKLTVLFLGRLVPRKGCQLLLDAVAGLVKVSGMPDFNVIVCGKGQLEPKLRRFIADHDLEKIVKLVGFVSEKDKPHYYASADISVFPSTGGESFGIVLLEAMASGRAAVLAGDNAGYRSVLSPRPELLFATQDATALTEKLRLYLLDEQARRSASAWGEAYAQQFDAAIVGGRLINIYEEALHKPAKA